MKAKQRSMLTLLAALGFVIYAAVSVSAGPTNQAPVGSISPREENPKLTAVIISNVGLQRTAMPPVLLYTDEFGWRRRLKKFSPHEAESVKGEKCDRGVLDKLLAGVREKPHWVSGGRYGNTEMEFYRSDGKHQAFIMDKEDTTAVVETVRAHLPTNSIIWGCLSLINRDFLPEGK